MNNFHNKTRLIGKIGFLDTDIQDKGLKRVRFQICVKTAFRDCKGKTHIKLLRHQCIALDKNANIIDKHTSTGDILAIEGVLVSIYDEKKSTDFPKAFVQVDEILLLEKN